MGRRSRRGRRLSAAERTESGRRPQALGKEAAQGQDRLHALRRWQTGAGRRRHSEEARLRGALPEAGLRATDRRGFQEGKGLSELGLAEMLVGEVPKRLPVDFAHRMLAGANEVAQRAVDELARRRHFLGVQAAGAEKTI